MERADIPGGREHTSGQPWGEHFTLNPFALRPRNVTLKKFPTKISDQFTKIQVYADEETKSTRGSHQPDSEAGRGIGGRGAARRATMTDGGPCSLAPGVHIVRCPPLKYGRDL